MFAIFSKRNKFLYFGSFQFYFNRKFNLNLILKITRFLDNISQKSF